MRGISQLLLGPATTLHRGTVCLGLWILSAALFMPPGFAPPIQGPNKAAPLSSVELTFLNVGQGDAAFIRSPEGKVALIDSGRGQDIVSTLRAHGIEMIDLAIASHAHADHIGGMASVIQQMPVRYYMDNGVPHTTATYSHLLQVLRASDVIYLEAVERTIELGSVKLRIFPLPAGGSADQNNLSVGVFVEYGDFRALLTGDSERRELQHFMSTGVPDVTLFKVPHHGSDDAVLQSFIAAISPEVAVISCGYGNQYGHPSPWTVTAYQRAGATVLRTDVDGEVQVLGDADGKYSVRTAATGLITTGETVPRAKIGPGISVAPQGAEIQQPVDLQTLVNALTIWVFADAPGNDHQNPNGEYAVVSNIGTTAIGISGWTLCDAASHCFIFPEGAEIPGSGRVVLFTGHGTTDGTNFFMNSGRAVWNNTGDTATLYDPMGRIVRRYVY